MGENAAEILLRLAFTQVLRDAFLAGWSGGLSESRNRSWEECFKEWLDRADVFGKNK